jgi:AraC-like DNA-binding protein
MITPSDQLAVYHLAPYLRLAMNHRVTGPFVLRPRVIFDYELLYLEKGSLIVETGPVVQTIRPGTLLLIRPGKTHTFRTPPGATETWMPHLHFDVLARADAARVPIWFRPASACTAVEQAWFRPDTLGEPPFALPDILEIPNHETVRDLILELVSLGDRTDQASILMVQSLLLQIIAALVKGHSYSREPRLFRCRESLAQVAERLRGASQQNWPLADLAASCRVSPATFTRLFRRQYGLPPRQYILHQRMRKACELLQYTDLSLTEIAAQVGYLSLQSFRRAFRRHRHIYPGTYRRQF